MRPQDLLHDSSSSIQVVMRRLGACLQGAQLFVWAMFLGAALGYFIMLNCFRYLAYTNC